MTSEQLRSVFHVESQDLVPHYEIVYLTHHGTSEHKISKRSVASTSSSALLQQNNQFDDTIERSKLNSHHVKKDLSKSAYYSEFKKTSILPVSSKSAPKSINSISSELNYIDSNNSVSSINNQSKLVRNNLSYSGFNIQNENQYKEYFTLPSEVPRMSESSDSDSDDQTKHIELDLSNIKEHNVSFSVFGELVNLTLRPNTRLFKNGAQSLQMFTVKVSPNEAHGLFYEPIEEVSQKIYNKIK